ncbi:MAG TPA: hypothetical protein ENK84_01590 [Desulfobulbus sp.]|nr:hypothetical protein [Desulfobulbus sp.]
MNSVPFKIGNTVKVKPGVLDPDFGNNIGGWQGRISEVDGDIVCIDWDSITLSNCPDKYIQRCEEEGLDWEKMYLSIEDIERASQHEFDADPSKIREGIYLKHRWDHLGDACKRIQEVMKQANGTDEYAMMMAWEQYLNKKLSFPFDAQITEYQHKVPLQEGDEVRIHRVIATDDHYGVIMSLRKGRKVFDYPLDHLTVSDRGSQNYSMVHDYNMWFSNR